MSDEASPPVARTEGDHAVAAKESVRPTSIEQRRRMVAESLQVGNLGNNARDLPAQADPTHDCQIELSVEDIRPYEHNPRRASNTKFNEIKASIRASGLRNPFTVTRRPGESHFVVEAGGNTRLLAIRQLWVETREPRFHKLGVLFRPWRSESHVLTAHLIENEQRGDMSFWDKASGAVALKAQLETEKATTLSLRQLEEAMKALGLSINTATLAHYLFATERLAILGEVVADLSGLDVKTLQPRLNAMKRHAQTRTSLADDELYATVFEPVFRQTADEYRRTPNFSAAAVCRACEEALAEVLGESVAELRMALEPATRSPQAPLDGSPAEPTVSTANTGMAAPRRHAQAEGAIPAKTEGAAAHSRVIEQVRLCAGLGGISDCLRSDEAAPLGYRMDALPVPAPADALYPSQQWAWQLLTLVSATAASPEGFAAGEPCAADGTSRVPDPPADAFQFDAAFFGWLVDASDRTASACWELLGLVREFRSSASTPGLPCSEIAAEDA
ncbi:MAG: ParB N-terminal domain-containing protein [Rhodocyclaceae bacterium]|nr:ParB N-terminal domain-containing protein [Rhodocyclaceae bacterium]